MERIEAGSSTVLESFGQCRGSRCSICICCTLRFWNREELFAVHYCIWNVTKYKANTESKTRFFLAAFHQSVPVKKHRLVLWSGISQFSVMARKFRVFQKCEGTPNLPDKIMNWDTRGVGRWSFDIKWSFIQLYNIQIFLLVLSYFQCAPQFGNDDVLGEQVKEITGHLRTSVKKRKQYEDGGHHDMLIEAPMFS